MCGSCYESFPLATMALVFTWMRLQVIRAVAESVDGLSPVERGCERWRPALQARGSCTNSPSQSRTSWRPRDYYARRNPERTMHRIIKQANAIGMTVRFDPIPA
jgi:hypothetical protein